MPNKPSDYMNISTYQLAGLLQRLPKSSYDKVLRFVSKEYEDLLRSGRMGMPWEPMPPEEPESEADNDTD